MSNLIKEQICFVSLAKCIVSLQHAISEKNSICTPLYLLRQGVLGVQILSVYVLFAASHYSSVSVSIIIRLGIDTISMPDNSRSVIQLHNAHKKAL